MRFSGSRECEAVCRLAKSFCEDLGRLECSRVWNFLSSSSYFMSLYFSPPLSLVFSLPFSRDLITSLSASLLTVDLLVLSCEKFCLLL